jgi:hypothetical protein
MPISLGVMNLLLANRSHRQSGKSDRRRFSLFILPENRLNAQFKPTLDQDANVMAQELAKHFVFHGRNFDVRFVVPVKKEPEK